MISVIICNVYQMKLNFIPHLPEELANQNQSLKSQLQLLKQQNAEFQSRLGVALDQIAPNKFPHLSSTQSLNQFLRLVKQQYSQLKSLQRHAEVARTQQEELQKQRIAQIKVITERDIEIASLKQHADEEGRRHAERQRQLEGDLEALQQSNDRILLELQKLKMDIITTPKNNDKLPPIQSQATTSDTSLESGSVQQVLRCELVRIILEKQEFQNKLQLKINQIHRSQKDKQALEQYYDQKWNSEYKKVKIKLEKAYNLKIAQLEEQAQLKTLSIQNSLRQLQDQKKYYLQRNQELEYRFNVDQKEKENLSNNINQLNQQTDDLITRNAENNLMFRQEVTTIKLQFNQQKAKLEESIIDLQKDNKILNQKLIKCQAQHIDDLFRLKEQHVSQLLAQTNNFQQEKSILTNSFSLQMNQLKQDIYQELDNAQIIKNQAERQFQTTLTKITEQHTKAIASKDEEFNKNNLRWIDKHCELEKLMSINRKKFEEEMQIKAAQIQRHIQKEYTLYRQIDQLRSEIAQRQAKIQDVQALIQQKNTIIAAHQNKISQLDKELTHSRHQAEILLANRKTWKNELLDVGRQFTKSFQQLKKIHQKQLTLYKGRIAELEELNNKNIINQKQKDKIQKLKEERTPYKPDIHIRQAENLILYKVKDYYETKIREEGDIAKTNYKNSHAILARKLKKNRAYVQEVSTHRVFEPKDPIIQKTRYSNSVQKHYNLSLSKSKFQEGYQKIRVQTVSSFK